MKRLLTTLLGMILFITTVRSQNITAAEYFIDSDPGVGNGVAITVSTPGDIVNFTASVPTASLSTGFHFLGIRVKDANGKWGLFEKRGFYVSSAASDAANIVAAEYFFDADPGVGNGTALSVGASGATVNFSPVIPTSLASGFHFLAIRVKGADGVWGLFEKRGFYTTSSTADAANIVAAEYFFDADPGLGNGTSLSIGASGAIVNFTASIPTALSVGFHFLAIRAKGSDGKWGLFEKRGFYISSAAVDAANITAAEYFFDTDPGVGNGTAVSVGASGGIVNFTATIPTSLPAGFHFLAIRTKGSDGKWGLFEKRGFYISTSTSDAANIVAAEYFINSDPGVGNATPLTITTTGSVVNETFLIPMTGFPEGSFNISIRVKGADGKWGLYEYRNFVIGPSSITCHADTALNTAIGECSKIVNGIDPTVFPPQPFNYVLTGATTGSGNGTASGLTFNAGVTTVTYALTNIPSLFCSFTVTVTPLAPVITTHPVSQAICVGGNVTFNTIATGSGLLYQWRKAGSNIAGASSSSYTINGLVVGDAGSYDVIVYTTCNTSDTSNVATLTVNTPPAISVQPVSQSLCPGNNVTFSVTATGSGLTYQWRKAGVNIGGATGSSYTINGIVAGNAGNYDVVISGICPPPVTSNTVSLTVNVPPAISVQPTSQTICAGNNITFNVTATGTALTYQWRKGGVNIGGATSNSYTITGVVTGDAGNYDVVVSGFCPPTVTSNSVSLTVNTAPAITVQPTNQTVCAGTNATFTVTATGTALIYQWRKGGVNISGATLSSFTINGAVTGDAGNYDVVVSGTCPPSSTSNTVSLTVNPITVIGTQPASQTVCAGTNVTFNVIATGTGVLTYQWKKNNVDISGATSSSYSINGVTAGDAASYTVVVTGGCGTATSSAAVLIVNPLTVITVQPTNQSSCPGGSVTFSVTATGTGVLTYQWKKDGNDIGGATSSSYTINPVSAGDAATYTVVVTGTCGTITSNGATLTISAGTIINTQPTNQASCLGGSVTFNVSASGSGTVTYQWKKNGVNIGGATSSNYTINPVTAGDAANYSVDVASLCGLTTSSAAALSIIPATVITTQPSNQTVCNGSNATFIVVATGDNLSYQWRKASVNISGATSSSYTITGVTVGDVANYDVVITGTCGTVTSSSVSLSLGDVVINNHPSSQAVCAGANVTFLVNATGTGITYQWRKSSVNISGATSSSYTITGVAAGDAGSYDVIVNGTCGAVTSNAATLTVNALPGITSQPTSQAVCLGTNVTFSVSATGTGITYQWRKGGVNISGATSSSFTITSVVAGDVGNYDVVISGICTPSAISNVAALSITQSPAISTQPATQTAFVGTNVTFTVVATGSGLTYQWRKGGVNIAGATNSSYTITNVALTDAGSYDVVVTGTCPPAVTSNAAVLTVLTIAITTQPANQSACVGNNATFSIVASGTGLTYQWQASTGGGPFTNIAGGTNSTLVLSGVTQSMNGNQYRCVVGGSLNSNAATLTVNPLPLVSLSLPFDTLYQNSPIQTLSGGTPSGATGVYSGIGVGAGLINPGAFQTGNYTVNYRFTDANGCFASASDVFTIISGVDKIKLFPNPAPNGQVTIIAAPELVGGKAIAYNEAGQKVSEWVISGRQSVHRFKWSAGNYTIFFVKGSVEVSKQIIIIR